MDSVDTLNRPLIGVRVFRLVKGWLAGISMYGDYFRPDEPRRAECRDQTPGLEPHSAPDAHWHNCGYHAWYTLDSATKNEMLQGDITGVVSAWGDVELHERGFRSEWMQVEAIVLHDGDPPKALRRIADTYAVPLISQSEIDSFCRERGEVMEPSEPVDAAQIQSEAFQEMQRRLVELHKKWVERMKPIMEQMKHSDAESGEARRKPAASWQEAIERKRNEPAFWREKAGGDVWHG